jgi:hypothetical protein
MPACFPFRSKRERPGFTGWADAARAQGRRQAAAKQGRTQRSVREEQPANARDSVGRPSGAGGAKLLGDNAQDAGGVERSLTQLALARIVTQLAALTDRLGTVRVRRVPNRSRSVLDDIRAQFDDFA